MSKINAGLEDIFSAVAKMPLNNMAEIEKRKWKFLQQATLWQGMWQHLILVSSYTSFNCVKSEHLAAILGCRAVDLPSTQHPANSQANTMIHPNLPPTTFKCSYLMNIHTCKPNLYRRYSCKLFAMKIMIHFGEHNTSDSILSFVDLAEEFAIDVTSSLALDMVLAH